jgi:hypothetical protein
MHRPHANTAGETPTQLKQNCKVAEHQLLQTLQAPHNSMLHQAAASKVELQHEHSWLKEPATPPPHPVSQLSRTTAT